MAAELTYYKNLTTVNGAPSSQMKWVCDVAEWTSVRDSLVRTYDAWGASSLDQMLKCARVDVHFLHDDVYSPKVELSCEFEPGYKVDARQPGLPFRRRYEICGDTVTISGAGATWASDGKAVGDTAKCLPTKRIVQRRTVLFGTRATFNAASYEQYEGLVNSDTFDGCSPGTQLFVSASGAERLIDDGAVVWDVELHCLKQVTGWNNFYRESTGDFEPLLINGAPPFSSISMSPLLT
jgi:hypothetical protein